VFPYIIAIIEAVTLREITTTTFLFITLICWIMRVWALAMATRREGVPFGITRRYIYGEIVTHTPHLIGVVNNPRETLTTPMMFFVEAPAGGVT